MLIHLFNFIFVPEKLLRMVAVKMLKDSGHIFNFTLFEVSLHYFDRRVNSKIFFFSCVYYIGFLGYKGILLIFLSGKS